MKEPAQTGNRPIDHIARGALVRLEAVFPRRIRACYIEGSYANGMALPTSDLDLTIVFCERFKSQAEREQARHLCSEYAAQVGAELDAEIVDEDSLRVYSKRPGTQRLAQETLTAWDGIL